MNSPKPLSTLIFSCIFFVSCMHKSADIVVPDNKVPQTKNRHIEYLSYLESLNRPQIDSIIQEQKQSNKVDKSNFRTSGGFEGTDDQFQVYGGMTETVTSPPFIATTYQIDATWVVVSQIADLWRVTADVRLDLTYGFSGPWTITSVTHKGSRFSGFSAGAVEWNETYGGGAPSNAGYAAYHEVKGTLVRLAMFYESVDAVRYFVLQP